MTMRNNMLFEVPTSHETYEYGNSYTNPEFEDEWEMSGEGEYGNPEFEDEWEMSGSSYYTNPEFEDEWEMSGEGEYGNPEFEDEWEVEESSYYDNPEYEFFKKLGQRLKKGFKKLGQVAKKIAPGVVRAVVGNIPGVGMIAGPLAGKLTQAIVKEAEMEVAQLETEFFGMNESDPEIGQTGAARDAALTEFLAAQAAEAATDAEAEAYLSAALPISISSVGAEKTLLPVVAVLTQANSRLVNALNQAGPAGKQLRRAVPAIQRRTAATLKAASRAGQPVKGSTAVKAMAVATNQVLGNPPKVAQAAQRNVALRKRTAPPTKPSARSRQQGNRESAGYCPNCGN